MSDLISRSALLDEIKDYQMDVVAKATAMYVIRNQPTVDAIPVVRCKDCFHWGNEKMSAETEKVKLCDYYYWPMYSEKYCANGERRRES